ncbi:UNVERIFIED_CONTAM: hypothetical protein GTU68_000287 [Idotea baltica]|nr:hypothetical protein [Idotea baltica]
MPPMWPPSLVITPSSVWSCVSPRARPRWRTSRFPPSQSNE